MTTLFDPPPRDGSTFDMDADGARLAAQHQRVLNVIKDKQWHTLGDIELLTGDPQASISARLRDFRKRRFGEMDIQRRRAPGRGPVSGTFEYRLGGG